MSPTLDIELVFKHVKCLLRSLNSDSTRESQVCWDSLINVLSSTSSSTLRRNVINYISEVPGVTRQILNSKGIQDHYCFVTKLDENSKEISELSTGNLVAKQDSIAIVNLRDIGNNFASLGTIANKFNFTTFVSWEESKEEIFSFIVRKHSRKLYQCIEAVGKQRFLVECFELNSEHKRGDIATSNHRVTLISSLFNGASYLPSFLENLTNSSSFSEVCLLIFDAGNSERDLQILAPYLAYYDNIKYYRLANDPGLYAIWNFGIFLARTEYVGNANLDDRRHPLQLQALITELDSDMEIMLTSTHVVPMTNFEADVYQYEADAPHVYFSWMSGQYQLNDMFIKNTDSFIETQCIPHCMPLWRKIMHEECGYFNEALYKSAADFELWLRGLHHKFKYTIIPIPASYYYINPTSYMRVDSSHHLVGEKMHAIYSKNAVTKSSPYWPDFEDLTRLVEFKIN